MAMLSLLFLVAMVLVWDPQRSHAPASPSLAPMGSARPALPETVVTRSDRSMLAPLSAIAAPATRLPDLIETDRVSMAIRQPLRVLHTQQPPLSLRDLVWHTLQGFDHPVSKSDPLFLLVVQLLAEGQSNRYIEAALQLSHDRGRITLPPALLRPDGAVDAGALLGGLIYMNASERGIPLPVAQARRSAPAGSLVAMVSR